MNDISIDYEKGSGVASILLSCLRLAGTEAAAKPMRTSAISREFGKLVDWLLTGEGKNNS